MSKTTPALSALAEHPAGGGQLALYAHLLVLPRGLSVEHAFEVSDSFLDAAVLLALGALVSALVVAVRCLGRDSPIGFWLAWMPLVLLPTLVVPLNVLVN